MADLNIEDSFSIKIPVDNHIILSQLQLATFKNFIIYKDKEDIYYFDPITGKIHVDMLLREYNYSIADTRLVGVLDDWIVLTNSANISLYHPDRKELVTKSLVGKSKNAIMPGFRLSTGNGFGLVNRTYDQFIPLVPTPMRNYILKEEPNLNFFNLTQLNSINVEWPGELMENILNCNSNLLSPMMEHDLSGNGINLVFSLSCRIFNIKKSGQVTEYRVEDPVCACEINNKNFVKATAYNFFPEELPVYGNVFPDRYRRHYYQFFQTEWKRELNSRKVFLRTLDENFTPISKVEIDWNAHKAHLLILKDGVFLQSNNPPDETHLYFHKLVLE